MLRKWCQVKDGLFRLGVRLSPARMDSFFAHLDRNGSGAVDFQEFLRLLASASLPSDQEGRRGASLSSGGSLSDGVQEALVRDAICTRFHNVQQVLFSFWTLENCSGGRVFAPTNSRLLHARLFIRSMLIKMDGFHYPNSLKVIHRISLSGTGISIWICRNSRPFWSQR
jgi:hypothetical protein